MPLPFARWRQALQRASAGYLLILTFGLAGCASQNSYVVLLPSPDGSVGKVIIKGDKGTQVLDEAGEAGTTDGRPITKAPASERLTADFGTAIAARPKPPIRYLLYFGAEVDLTSESQTLIPKILEEARSRPAPDLSIIGHTDTVYTTDYNEKLALRRASQVAEILRERGLKANSVLIESHGKRNLLILTPDNTYEPRNRRVEVSVR